MATVLMGVVLWLRTGLVARLTSYFVGFLIAMDVLLFAPVSGFSINPARTTRIGGLCPLSGRPSGSTSSRLCWA